MPTNVPSTVPLIAGSTGRGSCPDPHQTSGECQLIAITGGPGAGKTALLNFAQNLFCKHVLFVPESATIIFSGGFWRAQTHAGLVATQTAIFHVQRQLEAFAKAESNAMFALCDRGTVDCAAYWPDELGSLWTAVGSDRESEHLRYRAVIHLRTPPIENGYNHSNKVRLESAERAAEIDKRIEKAWDGHANRIIIDSQLDFEKKVALALASIRKVIKLGS